VTVLNASIPVVSVVGANKREIHVFEELKLYADAHFDFDCSGTASTRNLQYGWQVKQDNVVMANLSSVSNIASIFKLPPFSLSVDVMYTICVQVVDTGTDTSSESFVRVHVQRGRLIASLGSASIRTISLHEEVLISAESSFDQDRRDASLPAAVQFTWSCRGVDPHSLDECGLQFDASEGNISQVFVAKIIGSSVVTVDLKDDSGRKAAASLTIVVVDSPMPKLSVEASMSSLRYYSIASQQFVVNPNDKLKIKGFIELMLTATQLMPRAFNSSWTVNRGSDSDQLDLSSKVLTRTVRTIYTADFSPSGKGVQPMRFDLVVSPDALLGSCTYSFRFVAFDRMCSIELTVNAAPLPGAFTVSPGDGIELSTRFSLVASRWQDEDMPLYYTFCYLSPLEDQVVLAPQAEFSTVYSYLPAVTSAPDGFTIALMVVVEDCLFANASGYRTVMIRRDGQLSRLDRSAAILDLLNKSEGDYRATKQLIAVAAGVINVFNCSGAPSNCSNFYNRLECRVSFADNVCGPCLPAHVGIEGNDNSPCIATQPHDRNGFNNITLVQQGDFKGSDGTSCEVHCPREPFESCVQGSCAPTSKRCPVDCSGRGACEHYNSNTDEIAPQCLAVDPSCEARCNCEVGYFGLSCQLDSETYSQTSRMRERLLRLLHSQFAAEEMSLASATSGITSVIVLCRVVDELSLEALQLILPMVDLIFDSGNSPHISLTTEVLLPLTSALNSFLLGLYRYQSASPPANRSQVIEPDSGRLTEALDMYGRLLALDMVIGQDALSIVASEFKLLAAMLPFSTYLKASTKTLLPVMQFPLSDLEMLQHSAPFQLQPPPLVGTSNGGFLMSSHIVKSRLLASPSSHYDRLSNPLRISFTGTGPFDTTVGSYELIVVMQYNRIVDHMKPFEEPRSQICYDGDRFMQSYPCRTQPGRFLNLSCPGLPGVLSGRCAIRNASTACNAESLGTSLLSSCSAIQSNNFNVTCSCKMKFDNNRRALASSDAMGHSTSNISLQLSSTESVSIDHHEGAFNIDISGAVHEETHSVLYTISCYCIIIALSVCSLYVIDGKSRTAKVHPVPMQEEGPSWDPMGVLDGSEGLEDDENPLHGSDSIRRLESVVAQFRHEASLPHGVKMEDHGAKMTKTRLEK